MEKNSPNVFAVLNMKREEQQEKSFLLVAWGFFVLFCGFFSGVYPFFLHSLLPKLESRI